MPNIKELMMSAQGIIKADSIITNANLVSVTTGEIIENASIAIYKGIITRVLNKEEDINNYIGYRTKIIDARNNYVMPGFIESHIHIESSLLNVREFGKLEVIHGVTTVIADPHEIGNVLGYEGVKLFIEESKYALPRIYFEVPSCVPAVDINKGLDSGGKIINNDDIREMMKSEKIIGLGEVMDFESVLQGEKEMLERIEIAKSSNKVIEGHAPLLNKEKLDSYLIAGASSDHESSIVEEALEKVRKGMYVFMREGSAWKNLNELSELITNYKIDSRRLILVADDINVVDLVENGHLDYLINRAIELGIDPIKSIQMVTINPAEHLHIDDKIGIIAPGRYADLVFSENLNKININTTIIEGEVVYKDGKIIAKNKSDNFIYPKYASNTINLNRFNEEDILIKVKDDLREVNTNIIKAIPGSSLTEKVVEELPVKKGFVSSDIERNIMHIAVVDRHHASGNIGKGFVKNLGIERGAIAQTIAHDTHNLIIAGYDVKDMITASKYVIESNGGIAYVDKGKLVSIVKLPIAGLINNSSYGEVYKELKQLEESLSAAGGSLNSVFMTLGLISLPVIPELRITDKGLVDVMKGKIIDPINRAQW
ncbi:MAG: adenine deaminase [Caldisphaera sp.]|uniref:adenine deaminase n=1 Tax=Caldisphaera sp. TaxID=2060322 RepID=UPI0039782B44